MRVIEGEYDDLPLPGPWSRPRGGAAGNEREEPDLPLPGPWDRRRGPFPAETGPDPETARRDGDADYAAAPPAREPEPVRGGAAFSGGAASPGEMADAGGEDRPPGAGEGRAPERRRAPADHLKKFFSPAGIYTGIVMAEILGPRGGRPGRRCRF